MKFPSSGGSRVVLLVCALTGVVLMGVPCGRKDDGGTTPDKAVIVSSFSPSNVRVDPSIAASEAVTLNLDGVGTFVFVGGQQWLDYDDSTAEFTAEIADLADRARRFELRMRAADYRLPRDLTVGGFELGLDPSSYVAQGGPVDTSRWRAFVRFTGRLTGVGALAGTDLTLELDPGHILQLGEGANNANIYFGAFARLLWHRAAGAGIPDGGAATLSMTLQADRVLRAEAALSEQPFHGSASRHAITLPGITNTLVFVRGGQFTERPDGTARLTGIAAEESDPARAFYVDLRFIGRIEPDDAGFPPAGSPKLELNTSSYLANGGPIDPATWTYYADFYGSFVGLRDLAGARLEAVRRGPAFQLGVGANGKNGRLGGAGWLDTIVVQQPSNGTFIGGSTGGDININLDEAGSGNCAAPALREEGLARYEGGHAFWLPGINTDFVFEPGAQFVEHADGSARLFGVIYSESAPEKRFSVNVDLADRIDPAAPGYPPADSPKLELQSSAYAVHGGPVDPEGWHYYATLVGTLDGLAGMRGAQLHIERRGPAFQVGLGANGKNQHFGGSGWLDVTVLAQPQTGAHLPTEDLHGDINVDFEGDCATCAGGAQRDAAFAQYQGNHAFYLPGISHDFVFEPGARFVERPDGTAWLVGVLMSPTRPGWRFRASVDFTGRIDPGDAAYPPQGSPKKELVAAGFVEHGGPVDTRSWRYYTGTTGRLEGLESLAGAVVNVSRFGPPMQVGMGASGKNLDFGLASWINVTLEAQPTTGIALPGVLQRGDINLDLMGSCMDCAGGAPEDQEVSNLGGHAAFWFQGLGSSSFEFEGPGEFEERGDGTARLAGVLRDIAGGDQRWAIELRFADRMDPSLGDPLPEESPKRDLRSERYADNGGPIDFMRWRYYAHTEGELIGLGQHAGALAHLTQMGPAFQVGQGASGRNERYGAAGWLFTCVVSQPTNGPFVQIGTGDYNLDLFGCDVCAAPAPRDEAATTTSGGHAFYFPGIGTDFIFDGPAPFVERPDGTARLTGTIYRPNEPQKRFRVEVDLWQRVDPGMVGHAPVGSPKLELRGPMYVAGGGTIDPSSWRYYQAFEGRAYGEGVYGGGELFFTRMGPSFQIGYGASGKNLEYGGAGWLDVVVVRQPTAGTALVLTQGLHGDININLNSGCD
ncbi:MAG: hypothetical protein R3F49_22265 [Planctomycetota bacterium]